MKCSVLFSTLVLALVSTNAYAQHSDVEFGYDNLSSPGAFVFDASDFTTEGFIFFESEMEELDPFTPGDFSSDEPGFATNGVEGLLVNEADEIWLNVLDASAHSSFGVGYVNYFNPTTEMMEASGRLGVYDNSAGTADLILSGGSIESGENPQFLGLGDDEGDIHDHLIVDLLDDDTAPTGAYGMMFQLQSDFATADGTMDLDSDPFWIVWNHGMTESDFDSIALPGFGVSAVPEPGTASCLVFVLASMSLGRRRRKQA